MVAALFISAAQGRGRVLVWSLRSNKTTGWGVQGTMTMQWIVASVPCHRGCTAPPLIITYEKACRFVVHRGVALQKRLVLCEKG